MCIGHLLVPGGFIDAEDPFHALVHNHSLVPYGLK